MKNLIIISCAIWVLSACQQKQEENVEVENMMMEKAEFAGDMALMSRQASPQPIVSQDISVVEEVDKQKIIKDGRLGLKVKDLKNAKISVDSLVKHHGGYYASENFNNTDFESSFNLVVRIPAAGFENLIMAMEAGLGTVLYKDVVARDVTEQFIDLETRIESKKEYFLRYKELLKQAKTVQDILNIEDRIRMLQEEIESTQGRLKYLNDQVSYSTLNVMLTTEKEFRFEPEKRDKFLGRLKQSILKGWIGMIDFLLYLFKLWPVWLAIAALVLAGKIWRRKK